MAKLNLNDIEPPSDGGAPDFKEQSHDHDALVDVFFDHLERNLVGAIQRADLVVGCMAWLTNKRVLGALAGLKHGCQVVVQKEDFLRPGPVGRSELQQLYGALQCPDRYHLPLRHAGGTSGVGLSYCGDPSCDPIRVMGIRHERGKNGPRMHHKFLVFCRLGAEEKWNDERDQMDRYEGFAPYAVWTGSFNATENATVSRENAVYIRSANIAKLYCAEWTRTLSLSEPLDWTSDYVAPEWRFGS